MATRSMPMVSCRPVSMAILSFVPTPSVLATNSGSVKPARFKSNSAPNPPSSESAPSRRVALASGLMASTSALPASMSTPASRYVIDLRGRWPVSLIVILCTIFRLFAPQPIPPAQRRHGPDSILASLLPLPWGVLAGFARCGQLAHLRIASRRVGLVSWLGVRCIRAAATGFAVSLALWTVGQPALAEDEVYTVAAYPVDAVASDAVTAKQKALAEGQQAAFRSLLKRLVPVTAYDQLERLKQVDAHELIEGVSVRDE